MQKKWYIFDNDHHLGPFSGDEIINLYRKNKISPSVLIWGEGDGDWITLRECREIWERIFPVSGKQTPDYPGIQKATPHHREPIDIYKKRKIQSPLDSAPKSPPDLPPIPISGGEYVAPVTPISAAVPETSPNEGRGRSFPDLPPLPTDSGDTIVVGNVVYKKEVTPSPSVSIQKARPKKKKVKKKKIVHSGMTEDDLQFMEEYQAKHKFPSWAKYSITSLCLIVIGLSFYLGHDIQKEEISFKNLDPKTMGQLSQIVKMNHLLDLKVKFALSKDQNEIWMATNREGPADLYLTLTSIPGKILSRKRVVINSTTQLKGNWASFGHLKLTEGVKLISGHYKVEVQGVRTSVMAKVFNFFKDLNWVKRYIKYDSELYFQGEILLSPDPPSEFHKRLENFKKKLNMQSMLPLKEELESLYTFQSLVDSSENLFLQSLKTIKKGHQIKTFEKEFARQLGSILNHFIFAQEKMGVKPHLKSIKIEKEKTSIKILGKKLAYIVASVVEETSKIKKMTKRKRKKLNSFFQKEFEKLKKESSKIMMTTKEKLLAFEDRREI